MPPAPDRPAVDGSLRLVLAADPPSVRDGLARMAASPPLSAMGAEHRATAELVLAEVLNNVAEHAYSGGAGDVAVTLRPFATGLHVLVQDQGRPMPGGNPPPGHLPTSSPAPADLPEGGFGWHLIRSLTRDLHYTRAKGQNRLSFVIPA